MEEDTNKAIAYNSAVLYGKMLINTACSLLTTRFALQALGIVDYGLYAVLGGIISFISVFNTIMLSSSNRFIAVAIGRGDMFEVNKQFNVNLVIHVAIALFVLFIAIPVGEWYIPRYVNYDGPLSNAFMVYLISVSGCIFSFIGVPYNGVLMAKERFIVFSLVEVVFHLIKMSVALLLVYNFEHKLLIYTLVMALSTAVPSIVYFLYCNRHFAQIVKLHIIKDRSMYKSVFGFSTWVGVGAVANIAKTQGAALVVNVFFDTIMNTAMGVANSISVYVSMFANGIAQPMQPQITKSYASGNKARTDDLLVMSTKYSFLLTLLMGASFLVSPEWLLSLWLGDVPPFAATFLVLLVIDHIIQSFNSGISNIIWASGRITLYQILTSLLNILSIVAGYFVLKGGAEAYYLTVTYIVFSIIRFFVIQWTLHHTLDYDNKILWKQSYLPSLFVILLFLPVLLLVDSLHPALRLLLSFLYLCILVCLVGLSKIERKKLISFVDSKWR